MKAVNFMAYLFLKKLKYNGIEIHSACNEAKCVVTERCIKT